jgi:molecular chaperone GrpE
MDNDEVMPDEPVSSEANASLIAERDALLAEKSELQNQMLRQRADFENSRRRAERERMESSEYSAMEAVRSIVPVLDDFERALGVPCTDAEYVRGM